LNRHGNLAPGAGVVKCLSAMLATRVIKRIVVAVIGGTVLLVGVALIVLPGPAFLVIPAGLAILALEFAWARRWLKKARDYFERWKP
jgi:uncharacterized protein (TIGR02611 family)